MTKASTPKQQNNKPFDVVIFIGRFQPLHLGHCFVMDKAFDYSDHLLVLIGSANRPPSLANPFNFIQRRALITQTIKTKPNQRLSFAPVDDVFYNDPLWLQLVQQAVEDVAPKAGRIAIIGYNKDNSSYYLKLFPQWTFITVENYQELSATPIRERYFASGAIDGEHLPAASTSLLHHFYNSKTYQTLAQEYQHIKAYQAKFENMPYPPIFQTADALVVASGHILVVRRGGAYGQGLLALPGGFLDSKETLLSCAVRELKEETTLDLSHIKPSTQMTFDDPKRSQRARTITTVFLFQVDELLPVTADDDASCAFWLPLGALAGELFFEDHYGIICRLLGVR